MENKPALKTEGQQGPPKWLTSSVKFLGILWTSWYQVGSLNLAMVGVFILRILTSASEEGDCFVKTVVNLASPSAAQGQNACVPVLVVLWIVTRATPLIRVYSRNKGTSPVARWLRIHFCNAGEVSSIPSQGTQISYALQQLRQASQLLSLHTAAKTDTAKEIER